MRPADKTFPSKTDAEVWLTRKEAEILDGQWIDPDAGKVLLSDYGAAWIEERPNLRPKTIQLYRYLLRRHIAPHFEAKTVAEVKEAHIRRWRKQLLDSEVSAVTTAKTYRLIKAILNTAVDDGIIRRNACRIKGAGLEKSPERPVLTIPEVFALAEVIDPRYGALVLLGTFGSLRWGELAALRRKDIDLALCTIRVERQLTEMPGGGYATGRPSQTPASARCRSLTLSCHASAGISANSPSRILKRLSSRPPRARHCDTATSGAASGSPRSKRQACQRFTFTT